jgi:hypothetical protein
VKQAVVIPLGFQVAGEGQSQWENEKEGKWSLRIKMVL